MGRQTFNDGSSLATVRAQLNKVLRDGSLNIKGDETVFHDKDWKFNTVNDIPVVQIYQEGTDDWITYDLTEIAKLSTENSTNPTIITEDNLHRFVTDVQIADWNSKSTDSDVAAAISTLIGGAPGTLDTLNEIAAAIADDDDYAASVQTALNLKANTSDVTPLTNNSMADDKHRHSELSSPGGTGVAIQIDDLKNVLISLGKLIVQNPTSGEDVIAAKFGANLYGDSSNTTYVEIGTEYEDGSSRVGSVNSSGNASKLVLETHGVGSGEWVRGAEIADGDMTIPYGGIKFGTDTAEANTLDDYEEGTWAPTISTGGVPPSFTYVNRGGNYTKIGRQIIAWFYADVSVTTQGTGTCGLLKSSLPYTPASDNLVASAYTRGGIALSHPTGATVGFLKWNNDNPSSASFAYFYDVLGGNGGAVAGMQTGKYAGYIIYEV